MKALVTVNDQHEVVIPETILHAPGLPPGTKIEVELTPRISTYVDPQNPEDESQLYSRLRIAFEEYRGTWRQRMLDDGYASVDDMMADIRPEW